ncbi:MAG TPA: hypothetical protein VK943_12190 [Arenibaculum sp.]|nr:hypothetical protein [Arenibaculum sp.]
MAEDRKPANEGEGNRTAARNYNEAATGHAKSGKSEKAAEAAKQVYEGSAGNELRRAEEAGKRHAAEEDPNVKR